MIRFVDLTGVYWSDPDNREPCCAFLDTVTDRFVHCANLDGHVFQSEFDYPLGEDGERLRALAPKGFWGPREPTHALLAATSEAGAPESSRRNEGDIARDAADHTCNAIEVVLERMLARAERMERGEEYRAGIADALAEVRAYDPPQTSTYPTEPK